VRASAPPSQRQSGRPCAHSGRPSDRHRGGDECVAAEPAFVRCAVELDQPGVDRLLIGGVEALERTGDLARDRRDGTADVEPAEPVAPVAPVDRLERAGRSTGRGDRPADGPARELDLGLDGRPAAAVPDPPAAHRHDPCPAHPPTSTAQAARKGASVRTGAKRKLRAKRRT
jgi:hypothetical protein